MEVKTEIEELQGKLHKYGLADVRFDANFGFILVSLDLSKAQLNAAHAGFIDLDISRPLNLEIKLNMQQITNFMPDTFVTMHYYALFAIIWIRNSGQTQTNE